jgi:hypothetical protein
MNDNLSIRQRLFYLLVILTAVILATGLMIIYNNTVRSVPIFISLLLSGIGIMLGLGLSQGGLVGLSLITVWTVVKQVIGVWSVDTLFFNLLELAMAGLAFLLGGLYHDRLKIILDIFDEDQIRLKRLDLEDKSVGLVKPSIGLLRLNEEEERSVRFRRPFSLILIMVKPQTGIDWEPGESKEIMRTIAANVKDTTRDADIPFLAADNRIAIILPETETSGANKVVSNIMKCMTTAQIVTQSGTSILIQGRAQIRFGFATFLGISDSQINMIEAAEQSLKENLQTNVGDLFQNIFIEWITVGEKILGEGPAATPSFGSKTEQPTQIQKAEATTSNIPINTDATITIKETLNQLGD